MHMFYCLNSFQVSFILRWHAIRMTSQKALWHLDLNSQSHTCSSLTTHFLQGTDKRLVKKTDAFCFNNIYHFNQGLIDCALFDKPVKSLLQYSYRYIIIFYIVVEKIGHLLRNYSFWAWKDLYFAKLVAIWVPVLRFFFLFHQKDQYTLKASKRYWNQVLS